MAENDAKVENTLKEKEKEIATMNADLKASQDLFKDSLVTIRSKTQQALILQQKLTEAEGKIKVKTDGDMTMKEVLDRVRGELSQQYTPIISKLQQELEAKDVYHMREIEKQEKLFKEEIKAIMAKQKDQDNILQDFKVKLSDKSRECASLVQISEHRLDQYNELMT